MKKIYKKFKICKSAIPVSIIIAIVSLSCCIFSQYQKNKIEMDTSSIYNNIETKQHENAEQINKKTIFETIYDISIVVFSATGVSFFMGLFIEKNEKNKLYYEILTNDLLSDKKFIQTLNKDKQLSLINNLERINFFGGNETYLAMYNSVRDKISNGNYDYYFTSHSIDVSCSINSQKSYIKKEIIRSVKLRSFEKNKNISNYVITSCSSKKIDDDNVKHFELKSVKINNKNINIKKDIQYSENNEINDYLKNCDFNTSSSYILKNDLKLKNDQDTLIEIKYITRVPLNDNSYSVRLRRPCKEFNFLFRIKDANKCNIYSQAYGFHDDARNTPAGAKDNEIKYYFNDWIFPEDGVFLVFSQKTH